MNKEKFCLSSKIIDLSESENKSYIEMTNLVCYYDEPNLNGVRLPSEDAEQFAETMIDMPVYAKYRVNDKGQPTFGSHEVYLDDDGEIAFDTTPIGVHTSVEIVADTVVVSGVQKTLPVLMAKQKIWTRNKNAVAAIRRLYSEGKLHNSWEISNNAYNYENGIKTITDYAFEGNTLLGYEYADPAYGESAKVVSLSYDSRSSELLIAEALAKDMIENNSEQVEEDERLSIPNESQTEEVDVQAQEKVEPEDTSEIQDVSTEEINGETEPEVVAETEHNPGAEATPEDATGVVESVAESASLTDYDIRRKIEDAYESLTQKWAYVCYVFPEENKALLRTSDTQDELSYVQVNYVVNADDSVTVSDEQVIKLAVSISEINIKIGELNDAIVDLNNQLVSAKETISDLEPYRAAHEKAEHDKATSELRAYAQDSKQFTKQELEGEEMSALIESLNKDAIKAMISDRVVSTSSKHKQNTEAASVITKTNIYEKSEDVECSEVIKNFFARK